MTINKKRRRSPQSPKHGHEIEFNKKGRHPYKRSKETINLTNLEEDEDEDGFIIIGSRRYYTDNDEQ